MSGSDRMPRPAVWPAAWPFVVVGIAAIVAAGLTSAVLSTMLSQAGATGSALGAAEPAPYQRLAWLVAYLVLVVGVAQIGLGAGQAFLARLRPGPGVVVAEFAAFNLGNAGVVVGSLAGLPVLVDAGGAALVVALVLFLWTTRQPAAPRTLRRLYWVLVGILVISIPVGLVLAHLRHG